MTYMPGAVLGAVVASELTDSPDPMVKVASIVAGAMAGMVAWKAGDSAVQSICRARDEGRCR